MSFMSFLEAVGRDFKKVLNFILPIAATAGEVGVGLFAPTLSPMFNQTVNAVLLAEQSAAAAGKQSGTGTQKLANVLQLIEPLVAQGLADIGQSNKTQDVVNYINAVVLLLNSMPATPMQSVPIGPIVPSVPSV